MYQYFVESFLLDLVLNDIVVSVYVSEFVFSSIQLFILFIFGLC